MLCLLTIFNHSPRPYIPSRSVGVLLYGMKFNYPNLVDEAALHLSRQHIPLDELLEKLPKEAHIPWVRRLCHISRRNLLPIKNTSNNIPDTLSRSLEAHIQRATNKYSPKIPHSV